MNAPDPCQHTDPGRGNCDGERHYYVKQNGQWVCSICGATK